MTLIDLIGLIGVTLILGTYVLLQTGRISSKTVAYSALNALGAGLILISLAFDFNLSAALVEAFWLAISIYGIWRARTQAPADPEG